MNLAEFFYWSNQWLVIGCALGFLLLASEVGWRIGRYHCADDKLHRQVSGIAAAVLALLGLLLAFTFSMASSRYDQRKQLILEEANAIGTGWLRASLLDEPLCSEAQMLMRDYTDARVEMYDAGLDLPRLHAAADRSELLHRAMWETVVRVAREDSRPAVVYGIMDAVNKVIDLHEARIASLENYVPAGLILMLFGFAALSICLVGWTAGLAGRRSRAGTLVLTVLITMVLGVIIDLNRPQRGLIQTGQNSMLRLRNSLAETAPLQQQTSPLNHTQSSAQNKPRDSVSFPVK